MAFDIHTYENGKMGQLLFQIVDKSYAELYPAFMQFQKETGQRIDPNGDLVVDKYLSLLIAAIDGQKQAHPLGECCINMRKQAALSFLSEIKLKTLYDLAIALAQDPKRVADTQALTLDKAKPLIGLAGTYGLFGSDVWWENLKSGLIPTAVYEGQIEGLQFEGMHNEGRSFTLRLGDGGTYTYSCVANNKQGLKAYCVGQKARVTMLSERKKNSEVLQMVWTVEIEHD